MSLEKEWDDIESFVADLSDALDKEARTVRETELDAPGDYRTARLRLPGLPADNTEVFVDALGRVILPAKQKYEGLESVTFYDEGNGTDAPNHKVVRVEKRFRGDNVSALVVYLEEK